jgi:hypothetical protein
LVISLSSATVLWISRHERYRRWQPNPPRSILYMLDVTVSWKLHCRLLGSPKGCTYSSPPNKVSDLHFLFVPGCAMMVM